MALRPFSFLRRWFGRLFRFIDAGRRFAINFVFLVIVIAVVAALVKGAPPLLDQTTLVLALKGPLVEQRTGGVEENALAQFRGDELKSTQLRDVVAAIDGAAKDPQIVRALLILDDFEGSGMATLNEVAAALDRFKASGKPVIAWGSSYDQRQYYLAVHANQVLLHPMGSVDLHGFGGYRNYYRDALDKLGVGVALVRVGTYKDFAEPYIANGPSPAAQESERFLYDALWSGYTSAVEQARKLPPGAVMQLIDHLPERLVENGGDGAALAVKSKLVDALATRDELRRSLVGKGGDDPVHHTFRQIGYEDYVGRVAQALRSKPVGGAVGVVVAEGDIVDGEAAAGSIGGLSTAALIRKAREDDGIKAVVLRVDSPGGSPFGSELIRRELELTRDAGKPVVVSMGDVAASGGYWVTMAADEVVADPASITGSIGVFAILPHAEQALDKLGVHTAGTTTTWLAGAGDLRRAPDPRYLQMVQSGIDHVYSDFTRRAAVARKTTPERIDAVAQGRVWTGAQAKERNLVDTLGGMTVAIRSAATRAHVPVDRQHPDSLDGVRVTYIEPEPGKLDRVLGLLNGNLARIVAERIDAHVTTLTGLPPALTGGVRHDLRWLTAATAAGRPYVATAHCFCTAP